MFVNKKVVVGSLFLVLCVWDCLIVGENLHFVIEINDMAFYSKTTQFNTSMHTTAKVCFAMHNFDKSMQQPRKLDVIEVGQGK